MNLDDNYLDFEEPTPEEKTDKTKIIIAVAVGVDSSPTKPLVSSEGAGVGGVDFAVGVDCSSAVSCAVSLDSSVGTCVGAGCLSNCPFNACLISPILLNNWANLSLGSSMLFI